MANERMTMSSDGYARLRQREGVRFRYYNDAPQHGNCTWGVGTLAHLGPCTPEELRRIVLAADVDRVLHERVAEAERLVRQTVRSHPLNQAQFDAAVSFAYNSTSQNIAFALAPANSGDMASVAAQMMRNVYVHPHDAQGRVSGPAVHNRGLYHRRLGEAAPFLGSQQP